ncbi:MAG: DoxX family protein [Alistipes sp.]
MKETMKNWCAHYRAMDWAILYLRLFIGGIILLHNVGKMQDYNEIINAYPSFLSFSSAFIFVLITLLEVIIAIALIIGIHVRLTSSIMAMGLFASIIYILSKNGVATAELPFVYMGIAITLILSGAGIFSLDFAIQANRSMKKDK